MKYHALNTKFNVRFNDGAIEKYVVREAETTTDSKGNIFRVSCKSCAFAKLRYNYSCGYGRAEYVCMVQDAKCTPECREDGKMIEYKRIITK